ncbi:MAG: hypothetical protein S0880_08575 [Actinomycetota bacterium]|nr:hypothetical protein [Actinomycetota bacterium]
MAAGRVQQLRGASRGDRDERSERAGPERDTPAHLRASDPEAALAELRRVQVASAPISLATERTLPVGEAFSGLLGDGLRRGTAVDTGGRAATSLALALVAGASAAGSWVAVVGIGSLGLAAVAELGVHPERLALVDAPEPGRWGSVLTALTEAFDVVVAGPTPHLRRQQADRLTARLRERGSSLVRVGWPARGWPGRPELSVRGVDVTWTGLGEGHGHLQARRVTVEVTGRRGADRPRRAELWLPDGDGRVRPLDAAERSDRSIDTGRGTRPALVPLEHAG